MSQKYFVEVDSRGDTCWYRDPEMKILHRLDGPAVEWANGNRAWWRDGQLHRVGAPAVESHNGCRVWYQNDQLHRLDGPAIEYPNGDVEYWIDGVRHTKTDFNIRVKKLTAPGVKEMTVAEVEKVLGHPVKIIK